MLLMSGARGELEKVVRFGHGDGSSDGTGTTSGTSNGTRRMVQPWNASVQVATTGTTHPDSSPDPMP